MAEKTLKVCIVMRSGTTAEWNSNEDFVLKPGEIGIEFPIDDSAKMKVGDQAETEWKNLPYFGGMKATVEGETLKIK